MTEQRLDTPIFVGGAGSSGTSLLARMLSRHPAIFCGTETSLFNKAAFYENDFGTVKAKLHEWLETGLPTNGYAQYFKILPRATDDLVKPEVVLQCAAEADSLRGFIDGIQSYCLTASNKSIFAEKTPSNTYSFRQLAKLYPKCLLIHAIRDGRDVVCSLMKRKFDVFASTSVWLYNTACGIGCRDLPNYMEYHYEELVEDPPAVLTRICERLGIAYTPALLEPGNNEFASKFFTAGAWSSNPAQPINRKSVGRYKTDLKAADYAQFCSVQLSRTGATRTGTPQYTALELLQTLGYSTEPPAERPSWAQGKWQQIRDNLRHKKRLIRRGWAPRRALTKFSLRGNS